MAEPAPEDLQGGRFQLSWRSVSRQRESTPVLALYLGSRTEHGYNPPSRATRARARRLDRLRHIETLVWLELSRGMLVSGQRFGGLAELSALRHLSHISLHCPKGELSFLRGLPPLRSLKLRRSRLAGDELRFLSGLPRLERLHVEDHALRELPLDGLERLRHIGISGHYAGPTRISPAMAESVAGLPSLVSLDLGSCALLPGALEPLCSQAGLLALSLKLPQRQETDISFLDNFEGLRRISLFCHPFSAAGFHHLGGLTDLEELRLHFYAGPPFTSGDLAPLEALEQLRHLTIYGLPAALEPEARALASKLGADLQVDSWEEIKRLEALYDRAF